jgi:hypothetical protein
MSFHDVTFKVVSISASVQGMPDDGTVEKETTLWHLILHREKTAGSKAKETNKLIDY